MCTLLTAFDGDCAGVCSDRDPIIKISSFQSKSSLFQNMLKTENHISHQSIFFIFEVHDFAPLDTKHDQEK